MERAEREADIRGKIEQIRSYLPASGYRMLLPELKKNGIIIGERKLRTILSKFKLGIKPKKKFVRTTDSEHEYPVYENYLKNFEVKNINEAWVADITYIRITTGFVYLAVILDLYSRKAIGWAISKKIDRYLAIDALNMAIKGRKPPEGVIHHSDRGVQYLCEDYIKILGDNKFIISCSRKGNPYDNAFAESFMATLKKNEVHLYEYDTYLDVVERVSKFIEDVYNKKRPHSSLGYLSPEEFEKEKKVE
jgi:putative transposase